MEPTIRMPLIMKNTVFTDKTTGEKRSGKIIDETKSTFRILIDEKIITVTKNNHIFTFNENGKTIEIDGQTIERRSEDRITKKSE